MPSPPPSYGPSSQHEAQRTFSLQKNLYATIASGRLCCQSILPSITFNSVSTTARDFGDDADHSIGQRCSYEVQPDCMHQHHLLLLPVQYVLPLSAYSPTAPHLVPLAPQIQMNIGQATSHRIPSLHCRLTHQNTRDTGSSS